MPSWKKVIISGSNAELASLYAPSITGSLQGTASFASTASNVQGGTARYIPIWNTSSSLSSSAIYQSATGNVGIGILSPTVQLDVSGSVEIIESASYMQDGSNVIYIAKGADTFYANTIGGSGAGTTGLYRQTVYGYAAGSLANGLSQTAIGSQAGSNNSGSNQTAIGALAGANNSGTNQTAIGLNAGLRNSGSYQTTVGVNAGVDNSGTAQTAMGYESGRFNTADYQTTVGYSAGYRNTGSSQTAYGYQAGVYNSGSNQTATGFQAGVRNQGTNQTVTGFQAGYENTATQQTAIGVNAGYQNAGSYQTTLGVNAGYQNSASYQTAVGINAGRNNSGSNQTAFGDEAGRLNSGGNQISIGSDSGYQNTGVGQVAVGAFAGYQNSGSYQVAIGNSAGISNAGLNQVAVGYQAGRLNTQNYQTTVGYESGYFNTGINQSAFGWRAGYSNSGSNQVAVGQQAGRSNIGSDNTNIGYQAGYYTTGVIVNTGSVQSVFLGSSTFAGGGNRTNQIIIGYNAEGIGSNSVVLGNNSILTTALKGFVGIGITTPTASLHINNTSTSASFLVEDSTNPDATSFVIDATGNVGIGTLTPTTKLTVQTSGSDDNSSAMIANFGKSPLSTAYGSAFIRVARYTTTSTQGAGDYTDIDHNSGGSSPHRYGTFGDTNIINGNRVTSGVYGNINFVTSGSTRMTIAGGTSAGRVGINKTTPNATLDVSGSAIISGSLTTTSSVAFKAYTSATSFPGTAVGYLAFDTAGNIITKEGVGAFPYTGSAQITGSLDITGSLIVTQGITGSLNGTASYAVNSITAQTASYLTNPIFKSEVILEYSEPVLYTTETGYPTSSSNSIIINNSAGYITGSISSTIIGPRAARFISESIGDVIIGKEAAADANNLIQNILIGQEAASNSSILTTNIAIGTSALANSDGVSDSISIGTGAGYNNSNVTSSIYIGYEAGQNTDNAYNNIIIGNYQNLPSGRNNSLNLAGVIFATASADLTEARVGIMVSNPTSASLQVNGNVWATSFTGSLNGTASFAATASNVQGGTARYIPIWNTSSSLSSSAIYQSATGNVGINITNPLNTLTIVATTASVRLQESSVSSKRLDFSVNGDGVAKISANQSSQKIAFETAGAEQMRITNTGNVGIGTTTPNATLDVNGNTIITGSLIVTNDFTLLGSASIQYITSSQLNIADNLITVNTYSPTFRFGGIAVIDSGSATPFQSGSLLFDSEQDEWKFVHKSPGASPITSSLLIMGPESYDLLGSEIHPTTNRIMKSLNDEHIGDSNITDTGTIVSINSNTEITGSLIVSSSLRVGGIIFGDGGTQLTGTTSITGSLIVTGSYASPAGNTIDSNALIQASLLYLSNNF